MRTTPALAGLTCLGRSWSWLPLEPCGTGQVDLVVAADDETVTEAGYTALITELTPLVTELASAHATALLSDVTSQVTAATALTAPVSAGQRFGAAKSDIKAGAASARNWQGSRAS